MKSVIDKSLNNILAIAMVFMMTVIIVPLIPGVNWVAEATTADNVQYIDADGKEQTCASATVVESSKSTVTWSAGWYVVKGSVNISGRITCNGAVHLILADGKTLTASKGITCIGGKNSFTVYGQSKGTGKLVAKGESYQAGIGGMDSDGSRNASNITINGGIVTATGGDNSAGIGGGRLGNAFSITINGGEVSAKGESGGAGIGGGYYGDASEITINGGTINATGGTTAAGIGGGQHGTASYISINGGTITATGGIYGTRLGAGIGNGYGATKAAGKIYVADDVIVKAGKNANPTTVITHESKETDIATRLAGKQYAITEVAVASITSGGTTSKYATVQAAVEAATQGQTVKMIANSAENLTLNNDKNLTLDLNGKVLKGTGSGVVITNKGTLSIKDSDAAMENNHSVHYFIYNTDAAWDYIAEPTDAQKSSAVDFENMSSATPVSGKTVIAVKGGSITGGAKSTKGGGVYNTGVLTLQSGTICGCSTQSTQSAGSAGGAVSNEGGSFEMSGGTICGCYAGDKTGKGSSGGGVWNNKTFTMTGGIIAYCRAGSGGGMFISGGNVTISDSSIINCTANTKGGGVFYNKGKLTVSGATIITDNRKGSGDTATANNVHLAGGNTIAVGSSGLKTNALIGVTTDDKPTAGTAVKITRSNGTNDYSANFVSDNKTYEIVENGTRTALVVASGIPVAQITKSGVTKKFASVQKAINYADNAGDTVVMIADSKERVTVASDDKLTLDLNGHVLNGAGNGIVITNDGTLSIEDSKSSDANAKHYFIYNSSAAWTYIAEPSDVQKAAAIDLNNMASAELTSGTSIIAVTGGVITGGTSSHDSGGGVANGGTLTMSGGNIVGNTSDHNGGGVYNKSNSYFTMSGGFISGNGSNIVTGGVANSGYFTMSGGSISFNTATQTCGGVHSSGIMMVSGNPVVAGNTIGTGVVRNVYLPTNKTIFVGEDGLKEGAAIGVSTEETPITIAGVAITYSDSADYSKYFTSDSRLYRVKFVKKTGDPSGRNHLELASYDINEIASDIISITLNDDAMTSEQAIEIAKAQMPYDLLLKSDAIIAYAKADNFSSNHRYKVIKATRNTSDWSVGDSDQTLDELKQNISTSCDVYVLGTATNHLHSFTYEADAANKTITATCSASGCELEDNKVTVALAVENMTYTGEAYAGASITGEDEWDAAGEAALSLEYAGRDGTTYTKSATAPTAAGKYTVTMTASGKSVSADFEITRKQLTISGTTVASKTYDGKDSAAVTAGTLSGVVGEEVVEVAGTGAFEDILAGEDKDVKVAYTISGTDAVNYQAPVDETLKADISKIEAVIRITANSNSKVYDGKELTDTGYSFTEGVLVDGDELNAVVKGSATNVGTSTNKVAEYSIMRGELDVTACYTIETVDGTLEIIADTRAYTGDSNDMAPWALLTLISVMGIAAYSLKRRNN